MNFCVLSTKFLMLLIFNFIQLQKSCYANDEKYEECKRPYKCGNVSLSYPFYDAVNRPLHCGYPGFHIECNNTIPKISMLSDIYYLVSLDDAASHTFSVAKQIYWDNSCLKNMSNTSINFTLYRYTLLDENITIFYDCPRANIMSANEYYCGNTSINSTKYYFITHSSESSHSQAADICHSRILVPIVKSLYWSITNLVNLTEVFRYAFQLEWLAENYLCDGCLGSGGECGYDTNMSRFTCYCPDRPYDSKCSSGSTSHKHKIYRIAGVILACIAIGIGMLALLACYFKKRYSTDNQDINAFLKKYGPLATKRYTYRSLKKIANSFNDKLGEGGYGIVYKGKLPNGRLVAVKLLKESKGNAEEFINEVSSIGKTNHVNVVTLLGFCFEGQRRALVYDFMPNGSLEKFIYGKKKNNKSLAWDELFQIAVGIARGLDYLHRGCNTRIVHFDIKPHNILLDENFCPKISDFGLAKPFQQNNSIISMSGARGTVGFIAPEVFISSFGGVSHKSDVYSYGMLVLDMVGRRQNENAEVEHSSEQYFPQWIYKELEQTEEFDQQDILNGEEKETLRKMILVSLWCIQTNPSRRPPMTRVVEMLEGPLESLQIPPTPYLFPLPISHLTSSSTATFPI